MISKSISSKTTSLLEFHMPICVWVLDTDAFISIAPKPNSSLSPDIKKLGPNTWPRMFKKIQAHSNILSAWRALGIEDKSVDEADPGVSPIRENLCLQ